MLLRFLRALLNCLRLALSFLGPNRIAHDVEQRAEVVEQPTKVCEIAVLREVLDTFPINYLCPYKIVSTAQCTRQS